ncbi:hypothetical protein FZI91_12410 [Mycobacterium sp. CBMA271]|uniref:WXG100 family type VII secretion target n=1 Tax=unclassified Mycobacteroides TaxID=2618759 RepID=UPI0012DD66DA|nr:MULTISPECIES: hypothetical protein [unclassified Mycobacteroides]MUM16004.1 hypothetical protein [Mycobacteroides sp. CBMA 326]MUM22496.1 hypothetical protein [Mycobacteroides sp. CBMA 271]
MTDPWHRGNDERDVIYGAQRALGPNVDGGTESVAIPMEDFSSWSHADIKAASDAFVTSDALEVARQWAGLAGKFESALTSFRGTLDAAINANWTGVAAEAAKTNISDYKSHAEKVNEGMGLMATKPAEAETGMAQVKGLMPEVVQVSPLEGGASRAQVEEHFAAQAQAQQKQDEARMIMRTVYAPVFQQASQGVPLLPPAAEFGSGAAVPVQPSSSEFGTGKPINPEKLKPIDEAAVRSAAAAALADPAQSATAGGAGGAAAAAASAGAAGGGSGAGAGGPASAAAAAGAARGTTPTSSGSTTATGPNTGSVPGTYGIGRWGKPAAAKDDEKDKNKKDDFSPLLAGPIVAGSYTAGAGMGLSAAPTASPMSGMGIAQPPTMMTPGQANQHHQEDEDQHFTPEFLVSIDNGNELVGPLPKVSPAVIGVWNDEHVAYQEPHTSPWDPRPYGQDRQDDED